MKPFSPSAISNGVLALSDDLATSLTSALLKAVSDAASGIALRLREGRFEDAKVIARELTFTAALDAKEKDIRRFTRSTALTGAGAIDRPKTSIMAGEGGFPWEVDKGAVRLLQNMINHMLLKDTRRQLLDRIGRAERFQKAADPIDPDALANQINRFLRGEIRRVVDVSANIVGTRVAAYGMFYEARVRGISRYRIDAVLDDRTTEICRNMDQREFSVEQSFIRTGTLLSETDPTKQKALAPFPTLDDIREKSDAELAAMGHSTPPFHFLCRSVVTLIETTKTVDYAPAPDFPTTPPTEAQVRAFFEPYAAKWRDLIGVRPDQADAFVKMPGVFATKNPEVFKVWRYTGDSIPINRALRDNAKLSDLDQINAAAVERLYDNFDLPPGLVAYRGLSASALPDMAVGKVFQDDGFMSVSYTSTVAERFAKEGGVILQIVTTDKVRGLPLGTFSHYPDEAEIILERGTQLRIIGIEKRDGMTYVKAVAQGVGDILPLSRVGEATLPEPVSVVKDDERLRAKYVYAKGDLREASFGG